MIQPELAHCHVYEKLGRRRKGYTVAAAVLRGVIPTEVLSSGAIFHDVLGLSCGSGTTSRVQNAASEAFRCICKLV